MSDVQTRTCATCAHCLQAKLEGNFCRRYPPTPQALIGVDKFGQPVLAGLISNYPPVKLDGTCGEHRVGAFINA